MQAPALKRRLAVMLYEGLLLFGVVFIAGFLFDALTQSKHALFLRHWRQAFQFLVLGLYFSYAWNKSGQTLPMKTWRMRLVTADGGRVPAWRAVLRYVLAWMWFLPGLAAAWALDIKGWPSVGLLVLGMVLWALTIYLDPNRQYLHDRLAGTRLVHHETPMATMLR